MKKVVLLFFVLGIAISANASLTDGLVAHYEFENNLEDSANDYDGTGYGGASYTTGVSGNCLELDGIDDYVEISGYSGISGSASRTVSLWVNCEPSYPVTTGVDSRRGILTWGSISYNGSLFGIVQNSTDGTWGDPSSVRVAVQNGKLSGSTDIADSQWHNIVVVLEENSGTEYVSDFKIYVDGQLEVISYLQDCVVNTDDLLDVLIGTGVGTYFAGLIDDVRIYDRALSANEVIELSLLPEPATLSLLAIGGLTLIRRKRA